MPHRWMIWTGGALIAVGLACVAYIPLIEWRSRFVGQHLVQQAQQQMKDHSGLPVLDQLMTSKPPGNVSSLIGIVEIPGLGLKAPLLEGTDTKALDVGVGHLSSSVQPGQLGTSIIAAHNGTWFRHIDTLSSGNVIRIQTARSTIDFKVTGHQLVHTGDTVYNSTNATLVLETCYPLNALYLTPYRYLVFAEKVKEQPHAPVKPSMTTQTVYYQAEVPKQLSAQDLTIGGNRVPMGTLHVTGHPSRSYTQSNSPFYAVHAASVLYLAWLHAAAEGNEAAWSALGETGEKPGFWGVSVAQVHLARPFNVTLDVTGNHLNSIRADSSVTVNSRSYSIEMKMATSGSFVRLEQVQVSKG